MLDADQVPEAVFEEVAPAARGGHASEREDIYCSGALRPFSAAGDLAWAARSLWNSNVCKWPFGAMLRAIACDSDPLPVPAVRRAAV